MSAYLKSKTFLQRISLLILTVLFSFITTKSSAQDGKALFVANCASCHHPVNKSTGPPLKDRAATLPSKDWLYKWVHNSQALVLAGDKDAVAVYNEYGKTTMTSFPQLSEKEIDAIIAYVDAYKAPGPTTPNPGGNTGEPQEDNTVMYTIITLGLALLIFILTRVNKTLNKVANDKQGLATKRETPLFKSKVTIAIFSIILMCLAGYWITNGAINMGRQQNYMPKQPIFYSHKVHAGVNQINCLYCHAGAEKSRQAMIPSTNVCMNCHKQISEYTGTEKLITYEGKEVNGTQEIQKLYKAAGWDPEKRAYNRNADGSIAATPIEWVKIHNLPDHVYFNHSQHVAVGKVQCQTCHGAIQEMDEVHQDQPLSMGWCINCHRTTNVQFKENDYYSIYQKYHQEIKEGKREGVTEGEMGGTECQKCHY